MMPIKENDGHSTTDNNRQEALLEVSRCNNKNAWAVISAASRYTHRNMNNDNNRRRRCALAILFIALTMCGTVDSFRGSPLLPQQLSLSSISSSSSSSLKSESSYAFSYGKEPSSSSSSSKKSRDVQRRQKSDGGGGEIMNRSTIFKMIQFMKHTMMKCLQTDDFNGAMISIDEMLLFLKKISSSPSTEAATASSVLSTQDYVSINSIIDEALQAFTNQAFARPYIGYPARKRILMGIRIMNIQLSSNHNNEYVLMSPYNTIPKKTLLDALRALTGLCDNPQFIQNEQSSQDGGANVVDIITDSSFRILQRLITGTGIRYNNSRKQYCNSQLQEKDFNMVLNACSNVGRMEMAHKVIALQERTVNAPSLSPITYSILLKGYGRLQDIDNVKMIIKHAKANKVIPDTIMLNSLIDAYINCNSIENGYEIFQYMKQQKQSQVSVEENDLLVNHHDDILPDMDGICPKPNKRTYNTILKGFAQSGDIEQSLALVKEMETKGLWDDITTNTLVHAAIIANNFTLAEDILQRNTVDAKTPTMDLNGDRKYNKKNERDHPNVEAYTELLDAYAKNGELSKAIECLRKMKMNGVQPNEVTYTCLVAAFARNEEFKQAWKVIDYMESNGVYPTSITYNAFISGLLVSVPSTTDSSKASNSPTSFEYDEKVDQALTVMRTMLKKNIKPNDVTVSVLINALGKCEPPRVEEAKALIQSKNLLHFTTNEKVVSALVQTCALDGDIQGAINAFRKLKKPDIVAINSFLDACCRCNKEKIALETFRHYFGSSITYSSSYTSRKRNDDIENDNKMQPDVISYSVLISAFLKIEEIEGSGIALNLYQEMKNSRKIMPDNTLVDIILKLIIRTGRLNAKHINLIRTVLRDAEALIWEEGQLEKRNHAVRNVMAKRIRSGIDSINDNNSFRATTAANIEVKDDEDALFKRKGWNKVDSGFRLWGGGKLELEYVSNNDTRRQKRARAKSKSSSVDKFLESKGWNDVDSGFRIF